MELWTHREAVRSVHSLIGMVYSFDLLCYPEKRKLKYTA